MLRRLLVPSLLALAALTARAQSTGTPATDTAAPAPNTSTSASGDAELPAIFSRIRGIFDFDLPEIDPPGTIKMILHPHFGDLTKRDYLRTDVGLRWAVNDRWEFSADTLTYFHHGLRSGNSGAGLGEWEFDGKYIFDTGQQPEFEASVEMAVTLPNGAPPLDLTDGHRHFVPSFAVQHQSSHNPKLTNFGNFAIDFISPSQVPGMFSRNEPHYDSLALTVGAVYDLGQFKWTLSGTYTTTALISRHHDHFFTLNPSLLWFVPKRYTFYSKTQWIIGLGGRATTGPDGQDFSLSSKLRAEITFRQVMEKVRAVTTPARESR